jgi:hypothetical protein
MTSRLPKAALSRSSDILLAEDHPLMVTTLRRNIARDQPVSPGSRETDAAPAKNIAAPR